MKIKALIFITALILFVAPTSAQPCLAGNNETEEDVFDEAATTQSIETVVETPDSGNQDTEGENAASGNQTGETDISVTEDDVFDEGMDTVISGNSQGKDAGNGGAPSDDAAPGQSETDPDRKEGADPKTNADNKGGRADSASGKGTGVSSTTTSSKSAEKSATDKTEKSKDAQSKENSQSAESLKVMPIGAAALITVAVVGIIVILGKKILKHSN